MDATAYLFENLQKMHEIESKNKKQKLESINIKTESNESNEMETKWKILKTFVDENKKEECNEIKLEESTISDLQDVDFASLQDYDEDEHDGELFDYYRYADLNDFINEFKDKYVFENVDEEKEELDESCEKKEECDDSKIVEESKDDEIEDQENVDDDAKEDEKVDLVAFATNSKLPFDVFLTEIGKYIDGEILNDMMTKVLKDIEDGVIEIVEDEEDLEEVDESCKEELDVDDNVEEATSGIGAGSYTTKAIDLLENDENKVEYFTNKIDEENTRVGLVHILHDIRRCNKLSEDEKMNLENTIKDKFSTLD